jgi:hypothetical protein
VLITPNTHHPTIENPRIERERKKKGRGAVKASKLSTRIKVFNVIFKDE